MRILGLSAYYHDSAAALIEDGRIVAAAQEERFTRRKHDPRFPAHALRYCLSEAGADLRDLDAVVFYEKPFLKFDRLLETYLGVAPRGFRQFALAMPVWLSEKLFQKSLLIAELKTIDEAFDSARLKFCEHHLSHAASAFYPSPFARAVVLTLDGVGEWATGSVAIGNRPGLEIAREMHFPHSLGLLYSAFTYYLGFRVNSGEYKVMGLAPYGEPRYARKILDTLIDVKPDGSFRLDMAYFDYLAGLTMTNARFERLFGEPLRKPEALLTQFHMDIAASIQAVTDEVMLRMTRALASETREKNLCLAGGVAVNCVANGKIGRSGVFENIWVQPAAGDAGGAAGAALAALHIDFGRDAPIPQGRDGMQGAYLGPSFPQEEIERRLSKTGARFDILADTALLDAAASALAEGKALGWFQGRMEFGPRALGNRSILADPRNPSMQKTLNLRIKYRESFRPFAPAVLAEDAGDWFDWSGDAPYMSFVAGVLDSHRLAMPEQERELFGIDRLNVPRSSIPAVTHVDCSARLQTVHADTNPRFHALLTRFKRRTGCPVLVNTSFNVRGEPIVCTPEDAFRCFMGTDIDILVAGNCFLTKEGQDPSLRRSLKDAFAAD